MLIYKIREEYLSTLTLKDNSSCGICSIVVLFRHLQSNSMNTSWWTGWWWQWTGPTSYRGLACTQHDLLMRNWDQTEIGPGMETGDGDWGSWFFYCTSLMMLVFILFILYRVCPSYLHSSQYSVYILDQDRSFRLYWLYLYLLSVCIPPYIVLSLFDVISITMIAAISACSFATDKHCHRWIRQVCPERV